MTPRLWDGHAKAHDLKSGFWDAENRLMGNRPRQPRRSSGFSLTEIMIVVGLIGVLASTALPSFRKYQLRAKTAEVRSNLAGIQLAEDAYFGEFGVYLAADPEPAIVPGSSAAAFDATDTPFDSIGFSPEGYVMFSYGVAVSTDLTGYTIDAAADIDGDGIVQLWGYARPDAAEAKVAGAVGCDVSKIGLQSIDPCGPGFGKSVF